MSGTLKEFRVSAELVAIAKKRSGVLLDHFASTFVRSQFSLGDMAVAIYLQGLRDGMNAASACSDEPDQARPEAKVTVQ